MNLITLDLVQLIMAKTNGRHKKEASFGKRLAAIRKARGITQEELGKRIRVSRRMIVYYESQSDYIPGELIPAIAKALKVSADELLGLKDFKNQELKESIRLMNKLRMISQLPPKQRRSVIEYAEALVARNRSN